MIEEERSRVMKEQYHPMCGCRLNVAGDPEHNDYCLGKTAGAREELSRIADAMNPVPPCDKTADVKATRESILAAVKGWREAFAAQEKLIADLRLRNTPAVIPFGTPRN